MDIRKLKSFITIVDMGSITRAADVLHIAQPALSQQLANIEEHFRQKLLTRSQQGVTMTDAGKVIYRHAQVILRQMEQAQAEVLDAGAVLSGKVSVGLAPFSSAATLSLRLLEETRRLHPGIILHITESVSQPYSQMIMNGRLEMGLIHGSGPMRGVKFEPLQREEFVLAVHAKFGVQPSPDPITVAELGELPFLLPPAYNFVRRAINLAFTRSRTDLNVVAELESVRTISRCVDSGLGATIMPRAVADRIVAESNQQIIVRQISNPMIEEVLSLCISDTMPLSEPALAVKDILIELTRTLQ